MRARCILSTPEIKRLSHIVDGLFTLAMADAGELRLAFEPSIWRKSSRRPAPL